MFFQQVYDKTLAQASFFIGCQAKNEAIVIDAKRDIDSYLEIAKQNNMKITHIAETHIHADFLAGSRELAEVTGAKLYLSDEGGENWQYEFPHVGLKEGDVINVGNLSLKVMHTPGHTPESISFLLTDHPASEEPVMIFTGDFVFVGDIGRPDLLEEAAGLVGTKEIGAQQMFESLKKFAALPDYVQVWPGHGAGSACGKALGAVPSSTVGYEKIRNWAFQFGDDYEGFKNYLLSDQPEAPVYFAMMKKLNKVDRPLLVEVPEHPTLSVEEVEKMDDITLIDTRHKTEFAKGHLKDAINIQNNNSLANWAGWMIGYDENMVMIADEGNQEEITRKLMRIGLDNIKGFVTDLDSAELEKTKLVGADTVEAMKDNSDTVLLDVRGISEFKAEHIPGAEHRFVGSFRKKLPTDIKDKKIIIQCQSGDRATIAASYLEKNGFNQVYNYAGSFIDWKNQGKETTK
ncbi:MBL fold hydrolase [Sphingobacterium mizutaii NBRC 14946 = DSM 11724]|uniref:MBL fold hydrolase n=2 Tax=Sphingobacterium mizutaii TaxID=1010 RepID=A0ABQ0W3J7_9SPHI|nr:MBL fold metallo-hydrolase [Sphingobacterium mizutaii]GEM68524.1 MBL fold hydrolase [Sphingobacterium mizutaii NBRC 14946 = DSM 11724]SDK88438.1 hydroxyacylglutathione hydrolase [Sphingobacterium mizutaii]SNV46494.1 Probable polyketide biosynthesis zinc-dependent hydrolase BaeB [Sphingobacterium mizutaii]